MIGVSEWLPQQAAALQVLSRSVQRRPAVWARHDSSTWAGAQLQRRLPALAQFADTSVVEECRDAQTYLHNWNLRFHASSIGATIFEQWMRQGPLPILPDSTARVASAAFADSTARIQQRLRTTFRTAVRSLQQAYGPQLQQWR